MPGYDHLSCAFGPKTMTTLGVPVSELDVVYQVTLNHLRPIAVGRDNAYYAAYAILPTWTFLQLTWTESARLAILLARHLGLADTVWGHQPSTSLFTRLLNGTYSAGAHPTDRIVQFRNTDWVARAHKLQHTPNQKAEIVLIERAEAADLYTILEPLLYTLDPRSRTNPWLVDLIADAALPEALFGHTAHARLDFIRRRARLASEGRGALPDAFLAP